MRKVKFKVVRRIGERRVSAYAGGSYTLDYLENSMVRAREETLGVAVFERKYQAKKFCRKRSFFKIVRVLPVGRGRTVKEICRNQSAVVLNIFYSSEITNYSCYDLTPMLPPPGTIFYPAVEVLE